MTSATPLEPLSSLVGRDRELAELDRVLERVGQGASRAIEFVGEAGIGKSRMLAELRQRGEDRGFLVLDGRAAEFERDIPFGVIVDALNDPAEALRSSVLRGLDADALQELASILPSMSGLTQDRTAARAEIQRYRVHYAVRALLEMLARQRPVLLALDDIHWADAASLEVMAHIVRRFNGPLLAAFAYRPSRTRLVGTIEANARLGLVSRFDLEPLTAAEARTLIDPALDAEASELLYRASGGNPFYLGQLARSSDGIEGLDPAFPSGQWRVPPAVLAVIDHELSRLRTDHRRVLEAAAVAGETFEPGLVSAIAESDESAVLTAFDELLAAALLQPARAPRSFRFRHPIVRRAVYDAAPGGWRLTAHARAAAALASTGAPVGEQAHHVALCAVGGDGSAIALLVAAGREAAPRAPLTAGGWFLTAARLQTGDDHERAQLLGQAGALLTSGGGYQEAIAALDEALVLVPVDAPDVRAPLVARRAEARRRGGRSFVDPTELQGAVEALDDEATEQALDLRLELAMSRYWHADFAEMRALAVDIGATARDRGDTLVVCHAASLSSLAAGSTGSIDEAATAFDEARAAFAELPEERFAERVYITHYIAEAALRLEYLDEALALVYRGLDIARATGQHATTGSWWGVAVYALLLKGEVREARAIAQDALDDMALDTDDWRMLWMLAASSLAASVAGDGERAFASAREVVERSERTYPDTFLPDLGRIALAAALAVTGDATTVAAELAPLTAGGRRWLLDVNGARGWDLLIHAQLSLGDIDAAIDATSRARMPSADARLAHRAATVEACHASAQLAGGNPHDAVRTAEHALEVAESTKDPLLAGQCRTVLGTALAAMGDRDRAVAELESAERALAAVGATRDTDAAARELRRLGERVSRRPRADPGVGLSALSPREREIAQAVAAGKTNRKVAAALFLSEKTVESHLSSIYSKLDIHSRAALATFLAHATTEGA